MTNESTAYRDGWLAAESGHELITCPYDKETLKRKDWLRGALDYTKQPVQWRKEGFDAAAEGFDIADVPYERGSLARAWWLTGFSEHE